MHQTNRGPSNTTENLLKRLRLAMLAPLVVALISCGGGGDDAEEIEGFVTIEQPTAASTYETTHATLRVSGSRSSRAHSVSWGSGAGGSGAASLTLQQNCFAIFVVFAECNHAWNASIPLVVGDNLITVTGVHSEGDFGRDTITITRLACPANSAPEACS